MTRTVIATIVTRTNIGGTAGTGTIIGTITIEIMIEKRPGLMRRGFLSDQNVLVDSGK